MNSARQNIYLIGMMGSGKTTIGKRLAEILKMKFVDTDEHIEIVTQMKIPEIFSEYGETRFREMEKAYFEEKSKQPSQVFSTGGGIVLSKELRNILKNNGTTILLKARPETLAKRTLSPSARPLLMGYPDVEDRLKEIWQERRKLYENCAHLSLDTDNLESEQVVSEIVQWITKRRENH